MSSGLLIDHNSTSLPIPKLFPKIGKTDILMHKLDSAPASTPKTLRWDCFWYQGVGRETLKGNDSYSESMRLICPRLRGMVVDTYC